MTQAIQNPYVGPRPFTTSESSLFFGREAEVEALIPLVISERLVLFYAQSGAGKSSLINARLIPGLASRSFQVLPVGRVSGETAESDKADNLFVYNLLTRLDQGKTPASQLACTTITEYLANLDLFVPEDQAPSKQPAPELYVDAPQGEGGVEPLALIIDQFEELFTTRLDAWKQRQGFFEQIKAALDADPFLWIVLVMREDYVAEIDPYAYLLPGRLRARFFMQRMGYESALEAVRRPVEKLRPFDPGVAEKLVDNLRLIAVSEEGSGELRYVEGEFIEPVQLQVVCHQLWENLKERPGERITQDDLTHLAKGDDLAQFVNRALADFYENAIAGVLQDPPVKVSERRLREWFSTELITEAETRGSVFQGDRTTGGMPNEIVHLLESKFIIRSETRAARKWYELSHDRFIGPILKANREWNVRHPRTILADAQAWDAAGRAPAKLYEGARLNTAAQQMESAPEEFSPLEREFIQAGHIAGDRARSRRQRVLITIFSAGLLVLALLLVNSIYQTTQAVRSRQFAEEQSSFALTEQSKARLNEAVANLNLIEANSQRERAQTAQAQSELNRADAETQRNQALAQKSTAEAALTQAQGARLASLADYIRPTSLNLSLLYAVQAVKQYDNWQTRSVLLTSLQQSLERPIATEGLPFNADAPVLSVVFSPDGSKIASGQTSGLTIWNTEGHGRLPGIPSQVDSLFQIDAVAFDASGKYFAAAGDNRFVTLWNMESGDVTNLIAPNNTNPKALSLAFQPGGNLLAVGTEYNNQTFKGFLYLYDMQTRDLVKQFDCGIYSCWVSAWSPDGKKLAFGSGGAGNQGGIIQVASIESMEIIMNVKGHTGGVRSLAWYPDNRRMLSGGVDWRIVQWDTGSNANAQPLETSREETPNVTRALAVSPDGSIFLSGMTQEAGFLVWDAQTMKLLRTIPFATQPVTGIAFDQQGERFVTGASDGTVALWRYAPVDPLSEVLFQTGAASRLYAALQQMSDGKLITAQSAGSAAIIVKTEGSETGGNLPVDHTGLGFGLLNGESALLVGTNSGQVRFLDPLDGADLREPLTVAPGGEIRYPVLSEDQRLLAAAVCQADSGCNRVVVWDINTNQPAFEPLDGPSYVLEDVSALAVSTDHNKLAIGTAAGKILFYSIATGDLAQAVTISSLAPLSLAFSSAEKDLLAVGFANGEVALWEASTGAPIGSYSEKANGAVQALFFRPDGPEGALWLVSLTGSGEVREWTAGREQWVQRACALVQGRITEEERDRFEQSSTAAFPCP